MQKLVDAKHIAVVTMQPDKTLDIANKLKEIFKHTDRVMYTDNKLGIGDVRFDNIDDMIYQSQMVITLGGDGTFVHFAKIAAKYGRPILGINCGHLGFLTEIDSSKIREIIDMTFDIEERTMLDVEVFRDGESCGKYLVANEAAVERVDYVTAHHILVNDSYIDTVRSDGIVVSPPSGATGYALSAGAPFIEPTAENIIVTPVCPHHLSMRPIVLRPDSLVSIVHDTTDSRTHYKLRVDGEEICDVDDGVTIHVSKSSKKMRLCKLPHSGFSIPWMRKIKERLM